jgi:hypothetical protein
MRGDARLIAGNVAFGPQEALDVYAVPKVMHQRFGQHPSPMGTAALQVIIWRGDAQKRWMDDNNAGDGNTWHLDKSTSQALFSDI